MAFSYKNLWYLLVKIELNKTDFREKAGISTSTLAKLGKNEYVSMDVLDKICTSLGCRIEEIIEYVPNNPNK